MEPSTASLAGILLLQFQDVLYYKFNASVDQKYRANDLLAWQAILFGHRRGLPIGIKESLLAKNGMKRRLSYSAMSRNCSPIRACPTRSRRLRVTSYIAYLPKSAERPDSFVLTSLPKEQKLQLPLRSAWQWGRH